MFRQYSILAFIQLLFVIAQAQIPTLKIADDSDTSISLHKLKIIVTVAGNIASTSMEMTFHNSNSRVLEGSLTFPLPEGVSVSGYALDINGKLRDAVPVEKEKSTQVFESIERRKVDPGLLEKVEGNNFRTRIYPLPAGGNRTVRISYDETLQTGTSKAFRYHLPLVYTKAISDFQILINVIQATSPPIIEEQPGDIVFKDWNHNYSASLEKKNFIPSGSLRFSIPKNQQAPDLIMQKVKDDYYFFANISIEQLVRKRIPGKTIGLIWDVSLSGLKRNIASEIDLLNYYFKENPNCTVELTTINNQFEKKGRFSIINGNWNGLMKTIEGLKYDGATNFSAINLSAIPSSEYLLFSDGMSTFENSDFSLNNKPVFTICSALQSDFSNLQLIAQNSGAQFINLATRTSYDALKSLTEEAFRFIDIKDINTLSEVYPSRSTIINNGNISITGISALPDQNITLLFGYGNTVTLEKTIRINYNKQQTTYVNIQRFWAQQKINELDLEYENYKDEISMLGRQFSIVTRNTSLMVLETVEDYVRYKIEPPAELRKEYYAILKEKRNSDMEETWDTYDMISSIKGLFGWWNPAIKKPVTTKFTPPRIVNDQSISTTNNNGIPGSDSTLVARNEENKSEEEQTKIILRGLNSTSLYGSRADNALEGKISGVAVSSGNLQEVLVLGNSTRKNYATDPSIALSNWTPERLYLTIIEKEEPANYYTKYLELRNEHLSSPAFYFDIASFFFRKKDSITALKVLSNIAEMNIEDHELFIMLGFKLKEAKEYTNALYVFKKVLDWRPHEPQSYRHYALALADAGEWQQAADTLYAGLTKKYPEDIIDNYDGIQDVMIMDLNNLIAKQKGKIKTGLYNKKIIASMPVDIRVVLNWNRNDTDIDLWVTDPKGEKCFYGNSNTKNGALISSDMTDGYGPEQLMVRKALIGKYKIEVHYYGDDQVRLTGPSTIMVEIFTRYNSGKEERKIITLQMENDEEAEGIFVGEFSFG